MAYVRLESDVGLINRIANAPGVREFIRPDGACMDWAPLAALPPSITKCIVLSNGVDAMAVFEATTPFVFQSHILFTETCRGRRAIETGKAMVEWMFDHGALTLWGATPRRNRKARWFNRQLGAKVLDTSDEEDEIFAIQRPVIPACVVVH
jgi:hypothetical protein